MNADLTSFLTHVQQRVPLSHVIGRWVSLRPQGSEKTGRCPFHQEKTGSFTVNDAKGVYYCFGCGAKGDIVAFLRQKENLSFSEALQKLSELSGIALPAHSRTQSVTSSLTPLYQALELTCQWYERALEHNETAYLYLQSRGLNAKVIRFFRLGWAPKELHLWNKHCQDNRLVSADLEKAGLQKANFTPHFYARAMFPLRDLKGQIIAFGGRRLEEGPVKYINSPETPLFHKSRVLYGMYESSKSDRSLPLLIVEGYLDVMMVFQTRHARAVAPLGTACSPDHLQLAWRLHPLPIVAFDQDAAGQRATLRLALEALPMIGPDKTLSFLNFPSGQDPASFIASHGPEAFQALLNRCLPLVDYLWNHIQESFSRSTLPEQQAKVHETMTSWLEKITHPETRRLYRTQWWSRWQHLTGRFHDRLNSKTKTSKTLLPLMDSEFLQAGILLATLMNHPALLEEKQEDLANLSLPNHPGLHQCRDLILEWSAGDKILSLEAFFSACDKEQIWHLLCNERLYAHAAFARPTTALEEARLLWEASYETYLLHDIEEQMKRAQEHLKENISDEKAWQQLQALKAALARRNTSSIE